MGMQDTPLKRLAAADPRAVAEWVLGVPLETVEPLTVELLAEPVRADLVFRCAGRMA